MIRGIILYYLNIKPTHGYEIQQYIQLSCMDQWTKIQSGSIYYALNKLEQEKNITVLREEQTGSRIRKIYQITEQGKQTLHKEMEKELATPLFQLGSPKFITSPILSTLSGETIERIVKEHISELQENLKYWMTWDERKEGTDKYQLTKLSFQMAIESLKQQILWHEELLQHLDYYQEQAKTMGQMITSFDADSVAAIEETSATEEQLKLLTELKDILANNPEQALNNINEMIQQIKHKN